MQKTQAIETYYKNTKFRSRLEARWALFFDELGIMWDYEPQGFESHGIRYLPDFYLPELDYFFEVKPYAPSWDDFKKSAVCPYVCGSTILVAWGPPSIPVEEDLFDMVSIYEEYLSSLEEDKCLDIKDIKMPKKSDRYGRVAICHDSAILFLDGGTRLKIENEQFLACSLQTAEIKRCPGCEKFYFDAMWNGPDNRSSYSSDFICPFECELNDAYDYVVAAATKVRNHRFGKIA